MLVALTGTPGVGKTTIAKALGEKEYDQYVILTVDYLVKKYRLKCEFDKEKDCLIINPKKLQEIVNKELKEHANKVVIFESHLSHEIKADKYIVLTCSDIKLLQERLQDRGYSSAKVRENLDAEIFKVCEQEVLEKGVEPLVIDTAKVSVQEAAEQIIAFLKE